MNALVMFDYDGVIIEGKKADTLTIAVTWG
jgi:hypothetical protein